MSAPRRVKRTLCSFAWTIAFVRTMRSATWCTRSTSPRAPETEMPLTAPNLDDRQFADIVAEAKTLIPRYAPEWTNFNESDPGITLVELFAWMTEILTYRLNQVPDLNYI